MMRALVDHKFNPGAALFQLRGQCSAYLGRYFIIVGRHQQQQRRIRLIIALIALHHAAGILRNRRTKQLSRVFWRA